MPAASVTPAKRLACMGLSLRRIRTLRHVVLELGSRNGRRKMHFPAAEARQNATHRLEDAYFISFRRKLAQPVECLVEYRQRHRVRHGAEHAGNGRRDALFGLVEQLLEQLFARAGGR